MEEYRYQGLGIPDKEFIRSQIPMTKENIRVLSVAKLHLQRDSVVYDIGAGTGAMTVEMAYCCPQGKVYAMEQKKEGCDLILANIKKFNRNNIEVIHGIAPDCFQGLEAPSHVFIGGTGGKLLDIVREIRKKNPTARFVVNAITLETISRLMELSPKYPEYKDMGITSVAVATGKVLGNYHMMQAENTIYIAEF